MILKYIKFNSGHNQVFDFKQKEFFKIFIPDHIYDCNIDVDSVAKNLLDCRWRNTALVLADDFPTNWEEVPVVSFEEPKNFEELLNFTALANKHLPMYDNLITTSHEVDRFIHRFGAQISRSNRIEEIASKDDASASLYLHVVKSSFEKWSLEEVKRSPVWIYEYCVNNGFNEDLYNVMNMYAFTNPDSSYVKKFMNTKRFVPKNLRKKMLTKKAFVKQIITEMKKEGSYFYADKISNRCERNGYSISMATIRKVMAEEGVN